MDTSALKKVHLTKRVKNKSDERGLFNHGGSATGL